MSENDVAGGAPQERASNRLVQIAKLIQIAKETGHARIQSVNRERTFTTEGILLDVKRMKKSVAYFATLTDGREHIQLVFESADEKASPELLRWARVSVTGVPFMCGRDKDQARPSLLILSVNSLLTPPSIKFDEEGLQSEVTPRLVIGTLMALVCEQLEHDGYIRYESRFITNSDVDPSTDPLMVRFPGRGADVYLEVSPLPQLLNAAVMTSQRKIYTPTRLFSRAYRDGLTSADSPIVAAVEVQIGTPEIADVKDVTRLLIAGFNRAQDRGLPVDPVPDECITVIGDGDRVTDGSQKVIIRIRDLPEPIASGYAYDARKVFEVTAPSGLILVEGHQGLIANALPYTWICVHVERLALGDFWRIRERHGPESGTAA